MITGKRIIIRGIRKEDVKEIYTWVNNENLRSFTGTLYPISEYEHEVWIKSQFESTEKKLFLVCDRQTKKALGTIGLKYIDLVNRNAELFINLGMIEEIEGQGYGTDAVSTFVAYCFKHLNFHKIYLNVYESNLRAIRCYEKAGFKQEGKLMEHHFNNGKYESVIVMGIISSS